MAIIVNELSLTGQYGTKQEFISNIRTSGIILRCLNLFNVEILKGRDFYASMVTQDRSLLEIFYEKSPDPALQLFKSELLKIIADPFWENNQKHTCNDKYKFEQTPLLCQYGLAEATEDDRIVMSFSHPNYQTNNLSLKKNNDPVNLYNICNITTLQLKIIDLIESGLIKGDDDYPEYLPMTKVVQNLGMHDVDSFVSGKSKEEKIAVYKAWGQTIAKLNFWNLDRSVTNKNDRDVYFRKVDGKECYLSIDTENGTFEFFNQTGDHLGERNFVGIPTRKKPQSHKITL